MVLHTRIQEAVELGRIHGCKFEDALKQLSSLPEITEQAKEDCFHFYPDVILIPAKQATLLTTTSTSRQSNPV